MPRSIRLLFLTFFVLAPLQARGAPAKKSADVLRREAADYSRQGRHAEAAKAFQQALTLDPQNKTLLTDYMWSLWYSAQYAEALKAANKLSSLSKNSLEALNMIGRTQEQLGRFEEAKNAYVRSLELSPKQFPIMRALGRIYEDVKDYEKALRFYQDFVARQPDDAGVHAALGRVAYYQGRFKDAVSSYETALNLEPEERRYKFGKAQALYYAGRTSESIALLGDLVKVRPTDWRAVQFLVSAALVTNNKPLAYNVLEENLRESSPQDTSFLIQLSDLYRDAGLQEQFQTTLSRLLSQDPKNGTALLDKAEFALEHGNPQEAAVTFHQVTRLNPGSVFAWQGLAAAAAASSQTIRASEMIEEAVKLDPTDPELILQKSNYLYARGDYSASKQLLVKWLDSNEEQTLPILLYHGVLADPKDPQLAAPINVTVATLDAQLHALKDSGYTSITLKQAVDWFHDKGTLPEKSILLTFDDARMDSLTNADPVLKQYGFNAVMFAPIYNVVGNLPGFANWKVLAGYQATGRWDVQAHGDLGHTYIQTDEAGHKGLFLPNKLWLENEKRMETVAEWETRVRTDHANSKEKILKFLGHPVTVFAWPEGDYGQFGVPNFPESAAKNLKLCREAYTLCFTQNEFGINVRSRDPARAFRLEPRNGWTGKRLVQALSDGSPFVRMRRQLLLMATWEGKPLEAYAWLRKNAKSVSSSAVSLSDEAIIHRDLGDYARGLSMARQAQELENTADTSRLVESMQQRAGRDWTGFLSDFTDNQTRHDVTLRQTVGSFLIHQNVVRISHFHATHSQDGYENVTDNGLGVTVSRALGLYHDLSLQLDDHALPGRLGNIFGASGILRSRWTDTVETELTGGVVPYEFASALNNRVRNRYGGLEILLSERDSWKGHLRGNYSNFNDTKHARYSGDAQLSHPIVPGYDLRLMAQASYDHAQRVSNNYYSPRRLREYQLGLNYDGEIDKTLHLYLSFLPGSGQEAGGKAQFVQVYDANLRWDFSPNIAINPQFWITDTPSYNSAYFQIQAVYRFDGR